MCGIFGWFGSSPGDPQKLAAQISPLLRHRGPDDEGFFKSDCWGLGFRRLSILDLSPTGRQPMCTRDGRFWLVFNGEIYNYLELRRDLEEHGVQLRGSSDSEVLLELLARSGIQALSQLNGMFAFALVDTRSRVFWLARDRLGVKPLYYQTRPGQLRFASELKALLAWPDAQRRINPEGLAHYLTLNYLPAETCILEGYQKLPPAHSLFGSLDDPDHAILNRYWELEINGQSSQQKILPDHIEELGQLLSDAVRIRLRSDVPVGVFLSGGIDSGLIAALAAQSPIEKKPLALTVSFEVDEYDESNLARATAQRAGLEQIIIPQPASGLDDLDRLAWYFDEPFGDASALPMFTLCQTAAQYATVFLSGDGGDEAFGGYRRYLAAKRYQSLTWLNGEACVLIHHLTRRLPNLSPWHYRLLKASLPDHGYAAAFDSIPHDPAALLVLPRWLDLPAYRIGAPLWDRWALNREKDMLARQQALDFGLYLPDDILVKVDRASMAHSLEIRSPFLDYRLVEWAARLPRSALLDNHQGKLPLRRLAQQLLPSQVNMARKRGFAVPLDDWFRRPKGYAFTQERLLSEYNKQPELWNRAGVKSLLAAHQANRGRNFGALIWRLLFLEAWARHYLR